MMITAHLHLILRLRMSELYSATLAHVLVVNNNNNNLSLSFCYMCLQFSAKCFEFKGRHQRGNLILTRE